MLISTSTENSIITTYILSRLLDKGELKNVCQYYQDSPLTHYCAINLNSLDVKSIKAGGDIFDYLPLGGIIINEKDIKELALREAYIEARSSYQYPSLINPDMTPMNDSPSIKNEYFKIYNELFVEEAIISSISWTGFSLVLKQNLTERVYDEVVLAMKETNNLLIANNDQATILCHKFCEEYDDHFQDENH